MLNPSVTQQADSYAAQFRNASPFKHVCIDGFLEVAIATRLLREFPGFSGKKAINEAGEVGLKAVHENLSEISPFYGKVARYLGSKEFLSFMERVTGIDALVWGGESMYGGGTHENQDGIDLDPHVDFNYDDRNGLHRRLNLLVFLNQEWEDSWGGELELHSNPREPKVDVVKTFLPRFNRCVVFETNEHSWHGFPRITLPDSKKHLSRKSLAVYLYTQERPTEEIVGGHATFYVQRPLPDTVRPGELLSPEDYQWIQHLLDKRDAFLKIYQDMQIQSGADRAALSSQLELERAENQKLSQQLAAARASESDGRPIAEQTRRHDRVKRWLRRKLNA